MFTHDIIKLRYSIEGYLPNYPPHLISDEEMFEAFIPLGYFDFEPGKDVTMDQIMWNQFCSDDNPHYFMDNYPMIADNLLAQYKQLVSDIIYHIKMFLLDSSYSVPSWVYSYMLHSAIGPTSNKEDIHDLLVALMCDNIDDEYDEKACNACYNISCKYIGGLAKSARAYRPATMFGEPHVEKYLRMRDKI